MLFPWVFLWLFPFSYGFPIVVLWFSQFPMVFPWVVPLSRGFPTSFPIFHVGFSASPRNEWSGRLPAVAEHIPAAPGSFLGIRKSHRVSLVNTKGMGNEGEMNGILNILIGLKVEVKWFWMEKWHVLTREHQLQRMLVRNQGFHHKAEGFRPTIWPMSRSSWRWWPELKNFDSTRRSPTQTYRTIRYN